MAENTRVVFWEVDTQADFMLPGGKLYVPGAEKRVGNMQRLVEAASAGRVFLVSSADRHTRGDPEFQRFPAHCIRGTAGAEILPELVAGPPLVIPNESAYQMPAIENVRQIILEKQTLNVFDNPNAERIVAHFGGGEEFFVFGVVTEFCVALAARGLLDRGRKVALVTDAIETLDAAVGQKALDELASRGARLVSIEEALHAAHSTA